MSQQNTWEDPFGKNTRSWEPNPIIGCQGKGNNWTKGKKKHGVEMTKGKALAL